MRFLEGAVDDPSLHNPLQRMHRLGTGWFGVIFEYEGVIVEDAHDNHTRAWLELMEKEGRAKPMQWALKRAEGMKNEQVLSLPHLPHLSQAESAAVLHSRACLTPVLPRPILDTSARQHAGSRDVPCITGSCRPLYTFHRLHRLLQTTLEDTNTNLKRWL